jgi:hypothetical protein
MKCCLYKMPYLAAPIQVVGDVIANSMPTCDFLQMHQWEPDFFGSQVTRFVRDMFLHFKTPTWNFYEEIYKWRWYQMDYLSHYLRSPAKSTSSIAKSTSSISESRFCSDLLSWEKSLRNQEEQDDCKKRDVEQSAPTHAYHTHCTPMQLGTTANRRCDVPRVWLQEAYHMARVHWGTRCEGFL